MIKHKTCLFLIGIRMFLNRISNYFCILVHSGEKLMILGNELSTKTYKDFIDSDNFLEIKKRLFSDLDSKSVKVAEKIIWRISDIIYRQKDVLPLTLFEVYNLLRLRLSLSKKIREFSGNFKYKDYILPVNEFNESIFFDNYFLDELENKSNIVQKDIIDAGAYIGDSAIVLAKYTDKVVRAFEPVSKNYENMLKTIEMNNSSEKIIPYKFGLGSVDEQCAINIFEASAVASTLRAERSIHPNNKREIIQIKTLDEIVERENLKIGLIKVDIEGAEHDFLLGAMNTIKSQTPALLISIYHGGKDFFLLKSMIQDLDLGYRFKIRKATKPRVFDDTILICEV